jgi:hypothetical protein
LCSYTAASKAFTIKVLTVAVWSGLTYNLMRAIRMGWQ